MAYIALAIGVSAAATGIGTFVSVMGQRSAASAANQAAQYNAQIQRDQALREGQAAAENSRRKARENARLIGQQRAVIAQSGLAMEGTPLAVLGETSSMLQRDILDIGYDAANKANTLQASASMSLWQGRNQASALRTDAVTSGLSGLGRLADGYLNSSGLLAPKTPKTPKP